MKRPYRARIRASGRESAGMSLFPFLAVLMCTMGALILLLVVIARQARLQAARAAQADETASDRVREDLVAAQELVQLQISQLMVSRQKTEAQLAEARLKLGHIEDHARQLREELARLEAARNDLDKLRTETGRRKDEIQAELERLQADIAKATGLLAEAERAAGEWSKTFAVVPYEGPNQTRRRPIYLECRADAVVLQPEGIVFPASDFDGPLGPGNPLEVALRAAREYWLSRRAIDPEGAGEPYPLLLVRPGGIEAYYVARAAMKSWATEFGYELIDEDWKLEFQQPNEELAASVRSAVDVARARQQRLAKAAPSHFGGSSGSSSSLYRASPVRGGIVADEGATGNSERLPQYSRGEGPFASRFNAEDETGDKQSGPKEAEKTAAFAQQQDGEGTVVRRPGEWQESQPPSKRETPDSQPEHRDVQSLAKTRGQNWGLPDAGLGSIPITRPIRVDVYADRLVLVPERGLGGEKQIELESRTVNAVDELVSAVWSHMESWGIAGRGMYWRPVLKMRVAPGAEQRYSELRSLLDGSGIGVSRSDGPGSS